MTDKTNMTDLRRPGGSAPDCAQARERIHAVLDGDLMDAAARQALDRHLAGCADCRAFQVELEEIQTTLRRMPGLPLPDDALGEVLARTTQAAPSSSRLVHLGVGWRGAAAAALLAAALWSAWPTSPDQAQIDQAAAEARMVLMLTARALSRTQDAAIRGVMSDEVSPALSRVPMNMPKVPHEKDL